jgi:moderate conductance mechanosensitive channel
VDINDITTAVSDFWVAGGPLVQVAIIIVGAIITRLLIQFVVRRVVNRIVNGVKRKQNAEDTQALQNSPLAAVRLVQRTRTLGSVLSSIATTLIVIVAVLMIVNSINNNLTGAFSLITAALGAGLGFGAQNIIKDVLNGLFMVGEDQLGVGDVVDTNFATGVVEHVGIRVTQIRDVNGTLWYVRNGEIQRVGNMSQGWARVIIDLAVPYESDVDAVEARMLATANELASSTKWRSRILEKPEIWGLESISAEAIVIRLVVKTRSGTKDDVARELRARLKRALDDMGVRLPALNSIVLSGFEGASSVRGARPPKTKPITIPPSEDLKASTRRAAKKNG